MMRIEAPAPRLRLLFAVGGGGDPMRHFGLLQALAAQGCTVLAPHFNRLTSPVPSLAEVEARIDGLLAALEDVGEPDLPLVGLGHSLGTVALLALAGARGQVLSGEGFSVAQPLAFRRLVLLAPPAQFFGLPGALDRVEVLAQVWTGGADRITPPGLGASLAAGLSGRIPVDLRHDPAAGHFTFMDTPPPGQAEPHPDRTAFLRELAAAMGTFLTAI